MTQLLRLVIVVVLSVVATSCGNCSRDIYLYASLKNTLQEVVTVRYWSLNQKADTETRTTLFPNESRLVLMRTMKMPDSPDYPLDICAGSENAYDVVQFNPDTPYTICRVWWTYEIRPYGDSCSQ